MPTPWSSDGFEAVSLNFPKLIDFKIAQGDDCTWPLFDSNLSKHRKKQGGSNASKSANEVDQEAYLFSFLSMPDHPVCVPGPAVRDPDPDGPHAINPVLMINAELDDASGKVLKKGIDVDPNNLPADCNTQICTLKYTATLKKPDNSVPYPTVCGDLAHPYSCHNTPSSVDQLQQVVLVPPSQAKENVANAELARLKKTYCDSRAVRCKVITSFTKHQAHYAKN
ncbi:MAG: hypothetical protein K0S08_234 [Gammaproteobacteria bacterium]|nr:hypothetical protein [Gammaproteobacteria bacterium]